MLSEREKIIRKGLRKEKRKRWQVLEKARFDEALYQWEFWQAHMPIEKADMLYMFGRDSAHLRRHIRIELHYLKQSNERQFELETMFVGVK